MKVLFLDIDGVLNGTRSAVAFGGYPMDLDESALSKFDHVAVSMIRNLCRSQGISIVLSSAWRMQFSWSEVGSALVLPIIASTPVLWGRPRGHEIAAWLEDHPEVTQYAIVDDDADMSPDQLPFFVRTDGHEGLTWANVQQLAKIFGVSGFDARPAPSRTAITEGA